MAREPGLDHLRDDVLAVEVEDAGALEAGGDFDVEGDPGDASGLAAARVELR
jgi:hypothetical protein